MSNGFGEAAPGSDSSPLAHSGAESVASPASADGIAMLLAALVIADGGVDEAEVLLAHKACAELGVPLELFDAALGTASTDPSAGFMQALLKVEHPSERERLASILFEIASVDETLDSRETKLLETMRQAWGVSVAFLNKPIVWDDNQKAVIEARRSARLLVSAGPGMGKTAVACSRVAHLVEREDVADTNIWLVSFTRSAIAELKGRIGDFAEDSSNVFAVKISTIDSQAWKIRYGFSAEQAEKLFGGFETGITAALSLMNERAEDFREAFADLEHLIIDEAQDITGGRAMFLLKLISMLPKSCGVTVFHDPAQAIYDYAADGGAPFRFTDGLQAALGENLEAHGLQRIYRTEEPGLLKLYEDLRLDILGNADQGPDEFRAKADLVKKAAISVRDKGFDQAELSGYDDALVLFRKRIEVAQASAFMASGQIAHRLRMSGLPRMPMPWLASVLGQTEGRTLSKEAFIDCCHKARESIPAALYGEDIESNLPEARWERLGRYARAGRSEIDLYKLRARLVSAPPDEFIMSEFGHRGPILGTIHASKGREADHVFLQINDTWGSAERSAGDLAEEARVLFVGATRAKRSLAVQGGFAMPFATETQSGRGYRRIPKYKTGMQFQMGLAGDYDLYSAAALSSSIATATAATLPFRCSAHLDGAYIYRLRTADGVELGALGKKVNYDMMEIGKLNPKRGAKPPAKVDNIFVMGFGTMVAAPGDERLNGIKGPGSASGFWLVPQIVGLPMVFLGW
ncbi:UvrD-helicase domain-containing protein [Sphingomonas sp. CJ99]